MFEGKEPQNRRVALRDEAPRKNGGWWIVTDATTTSGDLEGDSGVLASLAHQPDSASRDASQRCAEDERYLARRTRALLQTRLHRTGTAGRPLPVYLNSLVSILCSAPREPLMRAIVALHCTRLRDGRVYVLTEETRAGLGSRLATDLRRQGIHALLVTQHMPESTTSINPARIETLLRPGDVVIGLQGDSPAYDDVREAAKAADAAFVVFGAEQDHAEKGVYAIACGNGDYQALDARLFFSHLICGVLAELVAPRRNAARAARLRQVS